MKKTLHTYFILRLSFALFICTYTPVYAQLDSVMAIVNKEYSVAKKINILITACDSLTNNKLTLLFSNKAYRLALSQNNKDLIARTAYQKSIELYKSKINDSVICYLDKAIFNYKKNSNNEGLYNALLKKFRFYKTELKSQLAFGVYKDLLKVTEELNEPEKLATVYRNMGSLFNDFEDSEKSIDFYTKALNIYTKTNDYKSTITCLRVLGDAHIVKSHNDMAMEYFSRGLSISKKNRNYEKAKLLTGIGNLFYSLNNFEKALLYFKEALSCPDSEDIIVLKNNIGVSLMELKKYKEAKPYLIEVYFSETSPTRNKADFASNLSAIYQNLGDYQNALSFLETYISLSDSLNKVQYAQDLSETEAKYRNEKQEEQNILLSERLKNKSLQIYFALAGILLLAGLVFFIFRGLRQKNKANLALAEKNKIIEEKNIIVEEQHKDITDSIKYAQRIQQAILPPDKLWESILPNSFIFYQPKDILSGDFYWIEETAEHLFLAAADCTGHGVPGALMSIVNYNLLNKAVVEQGLNNAGAILSGANKWLTQSLHQTYQESAVRDGMDVSLCVIDKKTKILNFAGAFNSIYIINGNNVTELLPDKQPVGAFIEDNIKDFNNQYHQLKEGDVVYMFTDGFADQFGGPKGKKYKYKNLQQLLINNQFKPFYEQKIIVSQAINDWKGGLEQIDDMLLIGFKI